MGSIHLTGVPKRRKTKTKAIIKEVIESFRLTKWPKLKWPVAW